MRLWNTEAKDRKLTFGWKNQNFKRPGSFCGKAAPQVLVYQDPGCQAATPEKKKKKGCNPLKRFYTQGSKDLFMKIQSTAMMAHTGAD